MNTDGITTERAPAAIVKSSDSELVSDIKAAQANADSYSWRVADGYAELARRGWTQQRIADEFGTNRSSVSRFIACAKKCAVPHNQRRPFWDVYKECHERPEEAPTAPPAAADEQPKPPTTRPPSRATATGRNPGDDDGPVAIKDAEGKTVPERAVRAFETAKEIADLGREIDALARKINDLKGRPGTRLIQFEDVALHIRNAKLLLTQNRATHLCPLCSGKDKECRCCAGERWTAEHVWKRLTEEKKK
jgi:hypothetical protein